MAEEKVGVKLDVTGQQDPQSFGRAAVNAIVDARLTRPATRDVLEWGVGPRRGRTGRPAVSRTARGGWWPVGEEAVSTTVVRRTTVTVLWIRVAGESESARP